MALGSTTLMALLMLAGFVNIVMFAIVSTQRGEKGAYPLMGIFFADGVWAIATLMVMQFSTMSAKLLSHNVRFLGPTLTTLAVFVFALQYSGRERYVRTRYVAALAVVPVLTNAFVWTDAYHGLIRTSATLDSSLPLGISFTFGAWFLVHALYSYSLSIGAQFLFLSKWLSLDASDEGRTRTALLMLGAFLPLTTSVVYVGGFTPIDYTPFTLLAAGMVYVVAIFRY